MNASRALTVALSCSLVALAAGCGDSSTGGSSTRTSDDSSAAALAGPHTVRAHPSAAGGGAAPAHRKRLDRAKLAGRWWVWAGRRGARLDPVSDLTGRDCRKDQPRDVFFLAGTFGGDARRTCTVPAGRPLFFPVLNRRCNISGNGDRAAADCARGMKQYATKVVTVDGANVRPAFLVSPPFDFAPAPTSPLRDSGGRSIAVGYHVLLEGLKRGRHSIHFRGNDPSSDFTLDVSYRLRVR